MTGPPASAPAPPPGDAQSPADIAAMRERLGELQRRNAELEAAQRSRFSWPGMFRAIAVVLLATLGALFLTLSVPTIWGRNLVLNTDRYVETLEPLAADPGIQQAVVKAVRQQFTSRVDLTEVADEALPPRAADLLAGPVRSAATGLVTTVTTRFVESDVFAHLWNAVNRASHVALVGILTGERPKNAALTVKNGMLYLDLAPIVGAVKQRLVDAGLTIAQDVPVTGPTIQLLEVKGLDKAQTAVRNLNRVAVLLPVAGLVCMAGAVLASRHRRREIIICSLATAGGMLVLAGGLLIGRQIYLAGLPLRYLTADDAGRVFDTLVRFLRYGLRIVFVVALLIGAIAWLAGPSRQARSIRRGVASAARSLTALAANWKYAGALARNRRSVSVGLVALAALILVLWTNPGVVTVLLIAAATAAIIGLVYTFPQASSDAPTNASPASSSATRRPS